MGVFNSKSRTRNFLRTSMVGSVCNFASIVMGFVYQTVFLHLLSVNYLGISGLFTNILRVLSLAELGIGSSITYRFYKPIADNDVEKVGQLVNYNKRVYRVIALVIFSLGMVLLPFLKYFIKDTSDVPADVNLQFVYFLHVVQTVSTYTYAYRRTILHADQKKYITAFITAALQLLRYAVQIAVLVLTRNYTLMMVASILITVVGNIAASWFFTRGYKEIFRVKSRLSRRERKTIWGDTGAIMLHRIGATVVNSTDNIVLTRFVGLTAGGLYSNYAQIIHSLTMTIQHLMGGGYNSSYGNALAVLPPEENFRIFSRLQFINLSIVGFCTSCLYLLVDPFVTLWVGKALLLDHLAVVALSIQFYLECCRFVVKAYNEANGNFVYDKLRPLISSAINLGVSIVLAIRLGVAGVFFGTVISNLCTFFWREPLLLFRHAFKRSMAPYWMQFGKHTAYTFSFIIAMSYLDGYMPLAVSWFGWLGKAFVIGSAYILFWFLLFHRTPEFQFFFALFKLHAKRLLKKGLSRFQKEKRGV